MFSSEIARMRKLGVQGVSSHTKVLVYVILLIGLTLTRTLTHSLARSLCVSMCVRRSLLSLAIRTSLQWMIAGEIRCFSKHSIC